jgi:hypothetical protein
LGRQLQAFDLEIKKALVLSKNVTDPRVTAP